LADKVSLYLTFVDKFDLVFQALTKFLKCVNWKLPQESRQGIELLTRWSPMDVEDALELLSPAFTHPTVRKYAVSRLRQADDQVYC
jgi:phosphatidylinositol 3-kinase